MALAMIPFIALRSSFETVAPGRGSANPNRPSTWFMLLQHRLHDANGRWSYENHENAGENKQHQREDKLHGRLGRLFFRNLLAPGPHRVGLDSQGLSDAGTKPVRLDQYGSQTANVIDAGAYAEVVENLAARPPHLHLKIAQ